GDPDAFSPVVSLEDTPAARKRGNAAGVEPQQGCVCLSLSSAAVTRFVAQSAAGQRRKETGRGGAGGGHGRKCHRGGRREVAQRAAPGVLGPNGFLNRGRVPLLTQVSTSTLPSLTSGLWGLGPIKLLMMFEVKCGKVALGSVPKEAEIPPAQLLSSGVSRSIGNVIYTQLKSTVYEVLASVLSLGQALQVSVDHLRALNATSAELQEGQQALAPAVQGHRERLLALLQEPGCRGCAEALDRAHALELGADFSQVPSVDDALHRLKGVPEANFSSMVQEENSTFNALPALAALQTADVIRELKKVVAQQPRELRTLAGRRLLAGAKWIVGCVLCSVVLLVVVCNLLGLNLGIWGLCNREDPSHSEAKGEAGARFLMVGVGFSFLFAAPLILLVFATFLVGGNVQTLVCRSWESGELYEFADTLGNLPSSMNLSQLLGLKKNLSVLLAYQQCKQGAALWTVLQLNDSYDLEKHLDISQYTAKLQQELQKLKVDVKNLDLLSPAARQDLEALQSSGLESIHYPGFLVEIQKPVVNISVEKLAQELERLSQTQGNTVLGQQLQKEAQGLRNLHQEKLLLQQSLVESECFLTREMGYFSQYMAWVREEVTQRIATCQPLSRALDNGRVILCDMAADPWNAFWFCLGWCTFLLIPSIIFAVKTSKYFRPIRKRL
ncbi:hypothetical protein E2I00_005018, partial [Balaenoptera physalus]